MTQGELNASLPRLKEAFSRAAPFRHVIIDDFLDPALARTILEEFPRPGEMRQHGGDLAVLKGFQISPRDERYAAKPSLGAMFAFLHSLEWRTWAAELCGEKEPLLCDPDYIGSGLLAAYDDGIHRIHLDRNRHPNGFFYPRLILLLYFNREWRPEYGGALELWDKRIRRATSIEPLFNRCVIFENTGRAYHGISDVHLPAGMARRALNFYYYTPDVPAGERDAFIHDTEFFPRPEERLGYWMKRARSNFPFGLVSALMHQWNPTARLYRSIRRAKRGGNKPEAGNRAELLKTWRQYNNTPIPGPTNESLAK